MREHLQKTMRTPWYAGLSHRGKLVVLDVLHQTSNQFPCLAIEEAPPYGLRLAHKDSRQGLSSPLWHKGVAELIGAGVLKRVQKEKKRNAPISDTKRYYRDYYMVCWPK